MIEQGILGKDRIRVLFRKPLRKQGSFENNRYGPYEVQDSVILPKTLAVKLIENRIASVDVERLSIKDVIDCFSIHDFGFFFERQKIIASLQILVESFQKLANNRKICRRCGNKMVPRFYCTKGSLRETEECLVCNSERSSKLFNCRLQDWLIVSLIQNTFQGKMADDVMQSLMTESTNRRIDFGINEKLPGRGTLIENPRIIAEKLEEFNTFNILLLGGINCVKLQIDDLFECRTQKKLPEALIPPNAKKRKKSGYYYPIHSLDEDSRFSVDVHVSWNRDKEAYGVAFTKIKEVLNLKSLVICRGDALPSQIMAAEECLPGVIHDFQNHSFVYTDDKGREHHFKDKGPCIIIERKNKDLRKTIKKGRRNVKLEPVKTRVSIAKIGQNYLHPYSAQELSEPWDPRQYFPQELIELRARQKENKLRERQITQVNAEAKRSIKRPPKSAAQMLGITWYPFEPYNWRLFLTWVDFVHANIGKIIKEGVNN